MEENIQPENTAPVPKATKKAPLPEVITVRNAKEYLGESLLIIFSVVLALLLTELFSKIHEDSRGKEIIRQLHDELVENKDKETIQYRYHLQVLKNIDSALLHPAYARQFIDSGQIHLGETIAPDGILRVDLTDVARKVATQNNAVSRLNLDTYRLLTRIYDQQQHIIKVEDEIGKVILSWESRKPENLRTTLLLMSNNYHAWAVDRAPALLIAYDQAIEKLSHY